MNSIVDEFDIAVQIRKEVVQQIVQAQHRVGLIRHHYVFPYNEKRVELVLNRPDLEFGSSNNEVIISLRLFYNSRDSSDATDLGAQAVVDVSISATLNLSTGNPGRLTSSAGIVVTSPKLNQDDIQIYGASITIEKEIKNVLNELISGYQNRKLVIPRLGSGNQVVGSLGYRFLSNQLFTVGLNFGTTVKGTPSNLGSSFLLHDWGMAISSDYILNSIRQSLRLQLGNRLPPPDGNAPVKISERSVCTLPSPFGCLDYTIQRVFITRLVISLQTGFMLIDGDLLVTTGAFYVPDIEASFSARIFLSISADQSIQVSIGQVESDARGFFSDIANFLSNGSIERIIENSIRDALQSGLQSGEITNLFSTELLSELGSLSSSTGLRVVPNANAIGITAEAVIIHGLVTVENRSTYPSVHFGMIKPQDALTTRIFHAGQSWAPGDQIVQYHWDFGDGNTLTTSGTNANFVVEHDFAPGEYDICLRITDSLGRARTSCKEKIAIAKLSLEHSANTYKGIELLPWQACLSQELIDAEFTVIDTETKLPISEATVTVTGNYLTNYVLTGQTDQDGKVSFRIDASKAWGGGLGWGYMRVQASKKKFASTRWEKLKFLDCKKLTEPVPTNLREPLSELFDKYHQILTGMPDLKDPIIDPYIQQAKDIGLTLDIMTRLVYLVEEGIFSINRESVSSPISVLLGIADSNEEALLNQFDATLKVISKSLSELEEIVLRRG